METRRSWVQPLHFTVASSEIEIYVKLYYREVKNLEINYERERIWVVWCLCTKYCYATHGTLEMFKSKFLHPWKTRVFVR